MYILYVHSIFFAILIVLGAKRPLQIILSARIYVHKCLHVCKCDCLIWQLARWAPITPWRTCLLIDTWLFRMVEAAISCDLGPELVKQLRASDHEALAMALQVWKALLRSEAILFTCCVQPSLRMSALPFVHLNSSKDFSSTTLLDIYTCFNPLGFCLF